MNNYFTHGMSAGYSKKVNYHDLAKELKTDCKGLAESSRNAIAEMEKINSRLSSQLGFESKGGR